MQVIHHADLTRQTCVIAKIGLRRKDRFLRIADRSWITRKYLDPTCRAARITAAAVKNVDPRILDREDQLAAVFGLDTNLAVRSLGSNYLHQKSPMVKIL